jgi:hypothetical protein
MVNYLCHRTDHERLAQVVEAVPVFDLSTFVVKELRIQGSEALAYQTQNGAKWCMNLLG